MAGEREVFVANDNIVEVVGLRDAVSGAYVNTASVKLTVKYADGSLVAGESWPMTLVYVTGSDGVYRGILRDTLVLSPGTFVVAEVDANDGPDRRAFWRIVWRVTERRE